MYYLINKKLESCSFEDVLKHEFPYVISFTEDEYMSNRELLGFKDDFYENEFDLRSTYVHANYDSLVGRFYIPDRNDVEEYATFRFVITDRGVIFIDGKDYVKKAIGNIILSKKWKYPSLERFIYDFLEEIIAQDLRVLEEYREEMDEMEDEIIETANDRIIPRAIIIRRELLELCSDYEQMIDLTQELIENENNFFPDENLRYFELFMGRLERLKSNADSLRDRTLQIRELYRSQIEVRQSRSMDYLSVIASVFMPITILTGWYGMNFDNMPELHHPMSYPALFTVCLVIVLLSIAYLKRKKFF